jgi:sodium/proline symporter
MSTDSIISLSVFFVTLLGTFVVSLLGRRHAKNVGGDTPGTQELNRWLIGLSAGATANSGFVVTGAVGLGYAYGAQWIMLPLAWLLGDIVFWSIFPAKINRVGREAGAATLTDLVVYKISGRSRTILKLLCSVVILVCLGGYVSAQWVAGQKFLMGAFEFDGVTSLLAFGLVIIAYSGIGGFRGSIYADSFQAVIRLAGTAIALLAVGWVASKDPLFWSRIESAGPSFLTLFPQGIGFVLGFAFAAFGFGLGQPQIITRFVAGASPEETKAAWWIYMSFVQFTWIAMTLFGVVLRGVMPSLSDPEAGLSIFFRQEMGPTLSGLIVADIFATISATSNSLLITMAQTVRHDLLDLLGRSRRLLNSPPATVALLGAATMAASLLLDESVFNLAITSVSLMGAGLAPVVMIRLLKLRCTGASLIASIVSGVAIAAGWKFGGMSGVMNESAPGICVGLVANYLIAHLGPCSSVD